MAGWVAAAENVNSDSAENPLRATLHDKKMSEGMKMSRRREFLDGYNAGTRAMDPDRAMEFAAPDFKFLDGALDYVITRENFAEYLLGWEERMQSIGGTGRYEASEELSQDLEDVLLSWGWWKFHGTNIEGSALIKVSDEGVVFEKIAYYRMPSK